MVLDIYLDSHIRIPLNQMKEEWVDGLEDYVSVENEEKARAIKEGVWGAKNQPNKFSLQEQINDYLVLPRGFLNQLLDLIDKGDIDYEINDQRVSIKSIFLDDVQAPSTLRGDQRRAIRSIESSQQGIINANPGRGKTVIALGAIAELKQKTLIIVDKINIAKQWQERALEHIDLKIGTIGDGIWEEKDVTVATQQTLWSRKEELDEQEWWGNWGMIILDECHHLPAVTFYNLLSRFSAKYRIGLSATVGKTPAKARTSILTFGEIIHKDESVDVKPEIQIVNTEFEFDYCPTHENSKGKLTRNNYQDLIKEIIKDEYRNNLIANIIVDNKSSCNLILSKRLQHLKDLKELVIKLGFPKDRCWMLTGKEDLETRMEIYKAADDANCAIFSTIADEALDIPRIDRIYLSFPQKNAETVKQQIGRSTRTHENKSSAIVYDFKDAKVGVLKSQFNTRLRQLYQPMKLKIKQYQ